MSIDNLPMVVSCSGCCTGGELADDIAAILKREGKVERMSVAPIVAGSPMHLNRLSQAKCVIAIDGCALACTKTCLQKAGISVTREINISSEMNALPQEAKQNALQCSVLLTAKLSQTFSKQLIQRFAVEHDSQQTNIVELFPCVRR